MEPLSYCNGCHHPPNGFALDEEQIHSQTKKLSLKRKLPIMSNSIPERVLKIPVTVNANSEYEDGLQIVRKIRPDWLKLDGQPEGGDSASSAGVGLERVQMKVFSGGITNKLVGFFLPSNPDDVVIVKIYGEKTEEFIDREKEISTMEFLHTNNFGSKLFAVFNNGIAYEYFPGEVLNIENCRDDSIYPLVAKTMANLHSIPLQKKSETGSISTSSVIWSMLRQFDEMSLESLEQKPEVAKRLEAVGYTKTWAVEQMTRMKALLDQEVDIPLGFCHNDILLGNVIYDEAKRKISFIDFEYAAVNYVPFDVANHFNEYAGVDDADYSRCPDQAFMRAWVEEYLKYYKGPGDNKEIGHYSVDGFMRWVNLCIPLSHLLWTVWASIQACHSSIDFDFVWYCNLRIPEYYKSLEYFENIASRTNGTS